MLAGILILHDLAASVLGMTGSFCHTCGYN